jgi:hypothetical protein
MADPFSPLFGRLSSPDLPNGLLESVVSRLRAKERRSALMRTSVFTLGLVVSAIALIPAFQSVREAMAESGFLAYLSLLVSDTGAMLSGWGNFSQILLESLPVFSVAFFLAILFVLIESALNLLNDAPKLLFHQTHNS